MEQLNEWMPEVFQGWTVNFIKANKWRVDPVMSFEDLKQEAYFCFHRCKIKYPVLEDRHLMGLYKAAVRNCFNSLSVEWCKHRGLVNTVDVRVLEYILDVREEVDYNFVNDVRKSAPKELRRLWIILKLDADLNSCPPVMRRKEGCRETTNQYYRRLLKLCAEKNIVKSLSKFFEREPV